jgi:hypothetical protein
LAARFFNLQSATRHLQPHLEQGASQNKMGFGDRQRIEKGFSDRDLSQSPASK